MAGPPLGPQEDGAADAVASAAAPDSRRLRVLAACCAVAFARMVDPKLWMMGLDIPATAFGAGWQGYRVFNAVVVLLLLAGMLVGGLLGDYFGRRRVLVWGAVVSAVARQRLHDRL